ncbi:hypothetical protein ACFL3Z_00320 [Gemmatimonadota bacterium]
MNMHARSRLPLFPLGALLLALPGCAEKPGSVPEVPASELTAQVAELDAVHEIMAPMWHDAFPARDFAAIQEAVPQFESRLAALDGVELPGILQDKAARWGEQKQLLMDSFEGLKTAAEADNQDGMLAYAEAFHMNYEGMVRIIRPVLPELEAFHQHLYGLYHYYGPGYDVEKMENAARDMAAAIPSLQGATLPENLASHQGHWGMVVDRMGQNIGALMSVLQDPNREDVNAAIEAVHADYSELEGIFDGGSADQHDHD